MSMVSNLQIDKKIKMKEIMKTKLLYMMLFMSIFSIMFVSCSGDEAENDSMSDSLEKS